MNLLSLGVVVVVLVAAVVPAVVVFPVAVPPLESLLAGMICLWLSRYFYDIARIRVIGVRLPVPFIPLELDISKVVRLR